VSDSIDLYKSRADSCSKNLLEPKIQQNLPKGDVEDRSVNVELATYEGLNGLRHESSVEGVNLPEVIGVSAEVSKSRAVAHVKNTRYQPEHIQWLIDYVVNEFDEKLEDRNWNMVAEAYGARFFEYKTPKMLRQKFNHLYAKGMAPAKPPVRETGKLTHWKNRGGFHNGRTPVFLIFIYVL
jgi:hypothetical protein